VRWDRLARIAMLAVLAVLLYLYISAGVSYLTTWATARHHSAQVSAMERDNLRLRVERASLTRAGTVEAEARRLGMVLPGERAYVLQNLPSN
jgi:cell division protein FtsL